MIDTWWMTNVVWYDGENAYVSKFILRYDIHSCMNPQDEVYIEDYFKGNGEILKYDRCYQIRNLEHINNLASYKDSDSLIERDQELYRAYTRWNEMMFGEED